MSDEEWRISNELGLDCLICDLSREVGADTYWQMVLELGQIITSFTCVGQGLYRSEYVRWFEIRIC